METAIETQPDLSISDLRGMMSGQAASQEAKPETSETEAAETQTEDNTQQAESETAETKPETKQEEHEEELPEGVKKRIAKEAERAARVQAEIDRAVSARKAKESELAKLTEADRGSDPDNKPQSAAATKYPEFGEKGHEGETYDQFRQREMAHVKAEAIREFEQRQEQKAAQERFNSRMQAAIEKHGKDFPAITDAVAAQIPEEMARAIGQMDGWDAVAVHLHKNAAQLKELADSWNSNPFETIAKLGRVRDALTAKKPETAASAAPKLPPPITKVGGNATASGQDLQTALESGSMSAFKATALKHGVRGRR